MRRTLLLATLALVATRAGAQPSAPVAAPIGDWTGTSLCLQGKPVCKDERVVYHIATRPATAADSARGEPLRITANKIVNGAEEWMVDLDCTWGASTARLTCPMPPQYAKGEWRFDRDGDRMTGGLWLDARGQVRVVDVRVRPTGGR